MESGLPAGVSVSCPECGLEIKVRRGEDHRDLRCAGCGAGFSAARERRLTEQPRIRAFCPECGGETTIATCDLGRDLVCAGCRTTFVVRRERCRHYRPGEVRTSFDIREQAASGGAPGAAPESMLRFWFSLAMIALLVLLCIAHWGDLGRILGFSR